MVYSVASKWAKRSLFGLKIVQTSLYTSYQMTIVFTCKNICIAVRKSCMHSSVTYRISSSCSPSAINPPSRFSEQVDVKGIHHFTLCYQIFNYHSYNLSQNYEASSSTVIYSVYQFENSWLLLMCTSRVFEYAKLLYRSFFNLSSHTMNKLEFLIYRSFRDMNPLDIHEWAHLFCFAQL